MKKKSTDLTVLVILILLLAISIFLLIGWQTGFVIKSPITAGLIAVGDNIITSQQTANNQDTSQSSVEVYRNSSSSHRSSSSSSSSDSSDGEDKNQTYDYGIVAFIQPNSMNLVVGNEFSVQVRINSPIDLYATEFKLNFEPSLISLVDITEGDFLSKDNAQTYSVTKINNTLGEATFATTRLATQTGVGGEGSLATLKFKTLNRGTGSIELSSLQLADLTLKQGIVAEKRGLSFVIN